MANEQDEGRDDEIAALMKADGVDSAKIAEQVAKKTGKVVKTSPVEDKKPDDKSDEKKPEDKKPEDKKEVPNPETIRTAMLNEMFGEQFKTVEDFKKANIPAQLQELVNLRQKNQELETQVKAKPKHHYANDDIAKYDEFVRSTGIKDVRIFDKLNVADVANMQPMDALILQHIIENPALANKDSQVLKRYFETKYNVDPKKIEAEELTQEELEINQIGVVADGEKAKAKLMEMKDKIKMPEILPDERPEDKNKWTPEVQSAQKASWEKVNSEMYKQFSKLPIHIKGAKEPIVNFELPQEAQSKILGNAIDYIISNQLEVNEANVKSVAQAMFQEIRETFFEDIVHAVFERARSMTEKEYLQIYHNPSSEKNSDLPPGGSEELSDEAKREKAFQAEMGR